MLKLAFRGSVPKSWVIYDGINLRKKEKKDLTLEIVFNKEYTYIDYIICLLRKKKGFLPPDEEDINNLKSYLYHLTQLSNEETKFWAYGTLDDELAEKLRSEGIKLSLLPNGYITKPTRINYAISTGKYSSVIKWYPQFKAYRFDVNMSSYFE